MRVFIDCQFGLQDYVRYHGILEPKSILAWLNDRFKIPELIRGVAGMRTEGCTLSVLSLC